MPPPPNDKTKGMINDPKRRHAPLFAPGKRDTATASQDAKPPPKMHAMKRKPAQIKADELAAKAAAEKKRRLEGDAARRTEEQATAVAALLRAPDAPADAADELPVTDATTTATATTTTETTAHLYPALANPTSTLSGCAPPDLEKHMLGLIKTLPTRPKGSSTYTALNRNEWPTFAVSSPLDCFFKNKGLVFGPPSTTYFIVPNLFGVRTTCHMCESDSKVVASTWVMKPLHGVGRRDYVMTCTHRCPGCPKGGEVKSPTVPFQHFISQLPEHIKLALPFSLMHNFKDYFVSNDLVNFIDNMIVKSTGATLAKCLKDMEVLNFTNYHLMHAHMHSSALHFPSVASPSPSTSIPNTCATTTPAPAPPPPVPPSLPHAPPAGLLVDLKETIGRANWGSKHLSTNTILDIYKVAALQRKPHVTSIFFSAGGLVLYMDHTFQEAKHIRMKGTPISAILTIMNEKGQIVKQWTVRSKSLHDMEDALKVAASPFITPFHHHFF